MANDVRQSGCVLVIDDDEGIRRLLRAVFTAKDLTVVEATSGTDAERRVAERRPDAIIIDLTSAETRGLDLLRRLRRRPDLEQVPVVLITALTPETVYRDAWAAGADDVVTKPFGVADLQQRVLRLLKEGRPRLRHTHRERRRLAG